jgi:hypothetical protein
MLSSLPVYLAGLFVAVAKKFSPQTLFCISVQTLGAL